MNIFMPGDKAYIAKLDVTGTVVGVFIGMTNTYYDVRYFQDGVPYTVSFFASELSSNVSENA